MPASDVATRRSNILWRWQNWGVPGNGVIDNSNGNSDGDGESDRNGDYGTMVIIPYKNELNDSAQKGQRLPLGKTCCQKADLIKLDITTCRRHQSYHDEEGNLAWFGCNPSSV